MGEGMRERDGVVACIRVGGRNQNLVRPIACAAPCAVSAGNRKGEGGREDRALRIKWRHGDQIRVE